jgi:hypothetical protein
LALGQFALPTPGSIHEYHRLHARNLEAFAAAQILAHHDVVFAQHVRTGFGKAGTVALVRPAGQLPLFGPDDPSHFVLRRLLTAGAVEVRWLLFLAFVKKLAFFHKLLGTNKTVSAPIIAILSQASYGKMSPVARKRKKKQFRAVTAVKALARERIGAPPGLRIVPDRKKKKKAEKHKPSLDELQDEL